MRIYPRCHPYWIENGKKIINKYPMGVSYSALGHLMPCCWADSAQKKLKKQFDFFGFFDEDLKLVNVDSVDQILYSDEWNFFHETLLTNVELAPDVCKRKCGQIVDDDTNIIAKV